MGTFIAAMIVFAAALMGMAIGVVASNKCITGSCGGLSNMPEGSNRSVCDSCAPASSPNEDSSKTEACEKEPVG